MTFTVPKDSDAAEIFAILGDPSAMRFTEVWPTIDACRNKLAVHRAQRAAIGYGPWAIRLGDDRRIIGWGGLYVDPSDAGWGLEIGYFLAPAAWGRGVATELVGFCCDLLVRRGWSGDLLSFSHRNNHTNGLGP